MPTALITGASTGIGQASALRLARAGWTVLAGVRSGEDGERLAGEAPAGFVQPLMLDVTDLEQIRLAAARVSELGGDRSGPGRLDALVNNAGVGVGGPLELVHPDDLRRQFDVNVLGQVAATQALLPALRAARTPRGAGGRIVFVSSIGGRVAMAFTAPYAASKHAIEAIGDALRVELRSSHVQVALVEPGSVATPIWDKGRAEAERVRIPDELRAEYGHIPEAMAKTLRTTAERGVPPEQVAATIERALTARRMKSRYVVGRDARAMLAIRRLLPDHVFDRVARRALGV
ncbi:MAG TPA: SDR family oxidoreductase [Solirubrobacteraceae bacterium]|jgi:NAD(P)-dependent dehydrogenase (short-subunit alcohol dehydrogenase family)|nr:SDR family oxidoreductase [Solirubrobacteraceae bacterium]